MSRFSHYDTDEERLPEGMTRVGYDADTQVYTFRDAADGSYWESAPGCQYGQLTRVGQGPPPPPPSSGGGYQPADGYQPKPSWRHELRPLLNFGMIIGLFLIFVFWFLHWSTTEDKLVCGDGTTGYTIHSGDTCWAIAESRGVAVDDLLRLNEGLKCDKLQIGSQICVPA